MKAVWGGRRPLWHAEARAPMAHGRGVPWTRKRPWCDKPALPFAGKQCLVRNNAYLDMKCPDPAGFPPKANPSRVSAEERGHTTGFTLLRRLGELERLGRNQATLDKLIDSE